MATLHRTGWVTEGLFRAGSLTLVVVLLTIGGTRAREPVPTGGGLRRLPAVEPPADYRAKWAVIIGIDDYSAGKGFDQLQNAANDAREFRRLLVEEFGYTDARILYLTDAAGEPKEIVDGRPTQAAVREAFEKWLPAQEPQADDSALVFFAGHGLRDDKGEGYLAAADSKAQDPKETCIQIGWIRDRLRDAKAVSCRHKLLLLDCCFSGTLFELSQPLVSRPHAVGAGPALGEVGYYLRGEAFFGMTAGLGDQPVADGVGGERHSVFTRALLQAMRERANSPREDHVFTFSELAAVLRPRVAETLARGDSRISQIPIAGRIEAGEGEFIFRQTINREVPWEKAARDERRAISERLANLADRVEVAFPERRVLFAAEGFQSRFPGDPPNASAESSLRRALDAVGGTALLGSPSDVNGLTFSYDGSAIVGTTVTNQVCAWRPGEPGCSEVLRTPPPGAASAVVSPRGDHAAALGRNGGIFVWKLSEGRAVGNPIRLPQQVPSRYNSSIAFSPDGKWVVAVTPGGVGTKPGPDRPVPRNETVDVSIYELPTLSEAAKPVARVTLKAGPVRFSPGGQFLIAGGANYFHDEVQVLDLTKPEDIWLLPRTGGVTGMQVMATSHSGRWMITKEGRYSPRLDVTRLWDLRDRRDFTLHVFKGDNALGGLDSAHVSGNGRWAATGTRKAQTIWKLDTMNARPPTPIVLPARKPPGNEAKEYDDLRIRGITPDGRYLLTDGMYFGTVWDLTAADPSANPRFLLPDAGKSWPRTDRLLITNSHVIDGKRDGTIEVWDLLADVPRKRVLRRHEGEVDEVAVRGDGRWLVSRAQGAVRLWDLSSPEPSDRSLIAVVANTGSDRVVAFSPDKRWLACAGSDGSLCLSRLDRSDPADGSERTGSSHGKPTAVEFSPDSRWVGWAIYGKGVVVCDPRASDALRRTVLYPLPPDAGAVWGGDQPGGRNEIIRLKFSDDGAWIAGVHANGVTQLWHLDPQQAPAASRLLEIEEPADPKKKPSRRAAKFRDEVAFCPGSAWLIGREFGKYVHLFRLTSAGTVSPPRVLSHSSPVLRTYVSPNGRWLLACTVEFGQRAIIHDLGADDGTITIQELGDKDERIHDACFTRDEAWLVTLGKDPTHRERVLFNDIRIRNARSVRLWKVPKRGGAWESVTLTGHSAQITKLLLTPGHRSLLTAGDDRTIRHWPLEAAFRQSDRCDVLSGHREKIVEVAVSEDGHRLAATDAARECLTWRLTGSNPGQNPIRLFTKTPTSVIHFMPQGLLVGRDVILAGGVLYRLTDNGRVPAPVSLPGLESDFFSDLSLLTDDVALLYKAGRIRRVLLREPDLLASARRTAGRNLAYGESKSEFASVEYRLTFPDLPVHGSYEFHYRSTIFQHVKSAEDHARRGNVKGLVAEYDAGLAKALTTSHGKVSHGYAALCLCCGQLLAALRAAEHASVLAPTDSEVLDLLALCQAMSGQRAPALETFNRADRLTTESVFDKLRAGCIDRLKRGDVPTQSCASINDVIGALDWGPERKAEVLLVRAIVFEAEGKKAEARAAAIAAAVWARTSQDPRVCNEVCWIGSLHGFAADVLAAGELAWERTRDVECLDTVAVAKALSGDRPGAISALSDVVEAMNRFAPVERRAYIDKRSAWLKELREGRNPFDEATLRSLKEGTE